jgi:amidohydrolase
MTNVNQQPINMEQATAIFPDLCRIRRKIHSFPETGFDLEKTGTLIRSWLDSIGIPYQSGVGRSGIVGMIRGNRPGPVVALRADMDALPIQEKNNVPYASRIKGIMHACGHDLHTTCLLGAAKLLAGYRERIPGAIKLIFQPAEEIDAGARAMIADGVLENPSVDILFGLHNFPGLPTGCIAIKSGSLMAGVDTFRISVKGRGGHAATPDQAVDALVVAASIVLQLQTIVSRNISPTKEAVITIGTFRAGVSENIIADLAEMRGTARTLDLGIREQFPGIIHRIVENSCKAFGALGKVEYQKVLPVLSNDRQAVDLLRQTASRLLGEKSVQTAEVTLGGEDFSLMLEQVPGCYFWLGATPSGTPIRSWHSPNFDLDENAIPIGSVVLAQVALDYLFTRAM